MLVRLFCKIKTRKLGFFFKQLKFSQASFLTSDGTTWPPFATWGMCKASYILALRVCLCSLAFLPDFSEKHNSGNCLRSGPAGYGRAPSNTLCQSQTLLSHQMCVVVKKPSWGRSWLHTPLWAELISADSLHFMQERMHCRIMLRNTCSRSQTAFISLQTRKYQD